MQAILGDVTRGNGFRLLADFKDIQLLFRYYAVFDKVIKPVITEVLAKLQLMVDEKLQEAQDAMARYIEE